MKYSIISKKMLCIFLKSPHAFRAFWLKSSLAFLILSLVIPNAYSFSFLKTETLTSFEQNDFCNSLGANDIGGTVFEDWDYDGLMNPNFVIGVEGVDVHAYDCDNNLVESTTSNSDGNYVFNSLTSGSYTIVFELPAEVSSWAKPTSGGTNNSSTVQVVSTGSCANLGIASATSYCQQNPLVSIPCYVQNNDPNLDVVVRFSYDNEGFANLDKTTITTASSAGALWGMTYHREQKLLFTSAVLKRHIPLGAEGLDAIYTIDPFSGLPNATPWIQLTDDLGIDVSDITANPQYLDNTTRGVNNSPSLDADAYADAGKMGIGGIELSHDEQTLYVVNLYDKTLYAIDVETKQLAASYPIPDPGCNAGESRPWAIGKRADKIYVGVTCDGSSSGNPNDVEDNSGVSNLTATIYCLENNTFQQVLDFPLDYEREPPFQYADDCAKVNHWKPWTDQVPVLCDFTTNTIGYPTPLLSDIEFDEGGSMILGFTDRTGFQVGFANYRPDNTNLISLFAGGDILRACATASGWEIENPTSGCASAGGLSIGQLDPEGYVMSWGLLEKAGEFYEGDFFHNDGNFDGTGLSFYPGHAEICVGGLLVVPGTDEVLLSAFDPVTGGPDFNRGGVISLSNIDGKRPRNGFQLYQTEGTGPTLGKGVGLGDLTALCDNAPVEIGNYVWLDDNQDGLQNACEPGIEGIVIDLYDATGTQLVGSTTTDQNGFYYFNNLNVDTVNYNGAQSDFTGLSVLTNYFIRINDAVGGNQQQNLAGNNLTVSDANNNASDLLDSDATLVNTSIAEILITTGDVGCSDHSVDFGFISSNCDTPVIETLSDEVICFGDAFTTENVTTDVTNGVNVIYQWFNNDGNDNPGFDPIAGQTTATLTSLPVDLGSYSYTVQATNVDDSSCNASEIVDLMINEGSTATEDYNGCQGDGFSMVINGTTYDEMNPTGVEILENQDINNCDSTININLVFESLPTSVAAASIDATCQQGISNANSDGTITLSGFTDEKYAYNLGNTFTGSETYATAIAIPTDGIIADDLPNPSGSQEYTVRVFNSNDCYVDINVTLYEMICDVCDVEITSNYISACTSNTFSTQIEIDWANAPVTGNIEYSLNGTGNFMPLSPGRSNFSAFATDEMINISSLTCDEIKTISLRFEAAPDCMENLEFIFNPGDPGGHIFCAENGEIITGGTISVTTPPGGSVLITEDGSTGRYYWLITGNPLVAGIYTMSYNSPAGHTITGIPGQLVGDTDDIMDPTSGSEDNPLGDDPLFLGSDTLSGGTHLADFNPAANPFFLDFDIELNDPFVNLNNIPLEGCYLLDYGDLPDITDGTGLGDYQTSELNSGPSHRIVDGLHIGLIVDEDLDGQNNPDADGDDEDGIDDEDGFTFQNNLNPTRGSTIEIPLAITNNTAETAHFEGWVDWNCDGDFDDVNESVIDIDDSVTAFPNSIMLAIPANACLDENIGIRLRLSKEDDMTPYNKVESGEVEDYLILLPCSQLCLPINIKRIKP